MVEARTRILCIEDDRDIATLIGEELVDRGFEVNIAYNGQDGLAAIFHDRPDLVLLDVSLPGMSGFEVLERLTKPVPQFEKPPFILLSALTDHNTQLRGRQLGADHYVTKPIDFDELEAIIRAHLVPRGM
jgi:DNA-binding response OmpR family regulator